MPALRFHDYNSLSVQHRAITVHPSPTITEHEVAIFAPLPLMTAVNLGTRMIDSMTIAAILSLLSIQNTLQEALYPRPESSTIDQSEKKTRSHGKDR